MSTRGQRDINAISGTLRHLHVIAGVRQQRHFRGCAAKRPAANPPADALAQIEHGRPAATCWHTAASGTRRRVIGRRPGAPGQPRFRRPEPAVRTGVASRQPSPHRASPARRPPAQPSPHRASPARIAPAQPAARQPSPRRAELVSARWVPGLGPALLTSRCTPQRRHRFIPATCRPVLYS
jgi:hypothetical protein